MKLLRFNENNELIIKDFEKLEIIKNKIFELNIQSLPLENKIYPLLIEYFELNPDRFINGYNNFSFDEFRITDILFYKKYSTYKFSMSFRYDDVYTEDQEIHFSHKEYEDIIEFMKDPDLYKNTKNFNL